MYSEWVEVMVRLTADLIWKSPHFFNTIKERELDLRGNKIAVIENLGATEVQNLIFLPFSFPLYLKVYIIMILSLYMLQL